MDLKLKLTFLLTAVLLLAGCGGRHQPVDSEEQGASEKQTLTQDTLPTFQSALGYFEASVKAFLDKRYRYAADFILAGIEVVKASHSELSKEEEDALGSAMRQLDRMAARLSRYELEGPVQQIQRDFARAQMEMAHILLIIEPVNDNSSIDQVTRLLEFGMDALQRAQPFLKGKANAIAAPIRESGRDILAGLSDGLTPAIRGEAITFTQRLRAFLSSYKEEIEVSD